MKLRVGVLQFDVALGDRMKNRATLQRWLKSALVPSDLTTVLVIPEIWDVGYALPRAKELADPEGKGGVSRRPCQAVRRLVCRGLGARLYA